jgi:hypothetical protein
MLSLDKKIGVSKTVAVMSQGASEYSSRLEQTAHKQARYIYADLLHRPLSSCNPVADHTFLAITDFSASLSSAYLAASFFGFVFSSRRCFQLLRFGDF